ncbi:MAG: cytochrome c family protein [Mesorhizobium sp.]|nr:cytochrome c family protein [Mesorhizobium sp.]
MDSFELNKLVGAFLAVAFVVFSVSIVSDSIFATHAPENPGYAIEVAEQPSGDAAPAEAGPSIAELLQTADAAAGESAFRKCQACHTAEEGGANKVGPNLWDIVNRPVASHEGFSYSAGMREFAADGTVWDYDHLSEFLKAPRSYVSGTAMAFAGIKNPEEEANLIAYLRTLSSNPAPLPEVAAEEAPAEDAAAPAAEGEAAPAAEDGAAPAEEQAAPAEETEAEPAQPETPDDGSAAAPETDAGTESGETTPQQQ